MAYFGSIIGCIIDNKYYCDSDKNYKPSLFFKSIDSLIASIPVPFCIAGAFLVSKQASFAFQIVFRYLLPSIFGNIYLFGYSEVVGRNLNI